MLSGVPRVTTRDPKYPHMDITDRIDLYVEALVREKTVPSSYQAKSPKTFGRAQVSRENFLFAPGFRLSQETRMALEQYKEDAYRDMNLTLRKYQHKLDKYYEKYGMPRFYKLGYQALSLLHDVYLGLRGQSKDRDLNVLHDKSYRTEAELRLTRLTSFFKRFPWQPLETMGDWKALTGVISDLSSPIWGVRELEKGVQGRRFALPPQTSQKIRTITKQLDDVYRQIQIAEDDMGHVNSFAIMDTIAKVTSKREMIVYRGGASAELGLPDSLGLTAAGSSKWKQAQSRVGKIVTRPAFLSATTDIEQTEDFSHSSKVMYVITVPAGMHCLPIDLLVKSHNSTEREILIGPDAKYRIDAIKRIQDDKASPTIPKNWRAWENVRVYVTLIDDGVHEL